MGLALGAALQRSGDLEQLVFFGRGMEPPPHPLFDGVPENPVEYRIWPAPLPANTTIVILAVPDGKLGEVAYELSLMGPPPPGCVALHLSGALSATPLEPLHAAGYSVGSMHPLQAVADPWHSGDRLVGAAFALAGEPGATAAARRLVSALSGLPLVISPALRPLYHTAAVLASNGLVAILSASVRLLVQAGVSRDDAERALIPLVRGTFDNLEHLGARGALTGPISRGDVDTVRLHLARLSGHDRALYCALGIELVHLARAAGIDAQRADELEALLAPS